jgi:hypothetical protein
MEGMLIPARFVGPGSFPHVTAKKMNSSNLE